MIYFLYYLIKDFISNQKYTTGKSSKMAHLLQIFSFATCSRAGLSKKSSRKAANCCATCSWLRKSYVKEAVFVSWSSADCSIEHLWLPLNKKWNLFQNFHLTLRGRRDRRWRVSWFRSRVGQVNTRTLDPCIGIISLTCFKFAVLMNYDHENIAI